MEYVSNNDINVDDFDNSLKIVKMIEAFEEDEDVESVHSNEKIDEELLLKVLEFIEKNTFRT